MTKIYRMLESEKLKKAREEVARVEEETLQLCAFIEESVHKMGEVITKLTEFQETMIPFQRDMAMMRWVMHANRHFPDDSKTQGKKYNTNV